MPGIRDLSLNERRLIELVFANGSLARVDLAQRSGMTGASVTRLTSGLLDIGIFIESVDRAGGLGQPKRQLTVNAEAFYSAGVTFSLERMEVALVNLAGRILADEVIGIADRDAQGVAAMAFEAVGTMRSQLGLLDSGFVGTGCSVPGNFGTMSTIVKAHALFPAFDDDRAGKAFQHAFDEPVAIENDGTCAALGEYVFARGDGEDPLFLIHIGHGVGGGAVLSGRVYRGAHGNACLPGVLFPYDQARPSGQDLLDTLRAAGHPIGEFDALENPEPEISAVVETWIGRAGVQLREAVRTASGFFDPAVVVIGGRLPQWINARLVDVILADPLAGPSRGLAVAPLRTSKLGPSAGAVGAACIPLTATFFPTAVADAGNAYLNGRIRNSS